MWKPRSCGMNISEQMLALFIIHHVVSHNNFIVRFMFPGMFHPPVNNYKNIEPHESPPNTNKSFSTSRSVIKEILCSLQCGAHISSHCSNTVEIGRGKCFVFDVTTSCVLLLASNTNESSFVKFMRFVAVEYLKGSSL